MVDEDVFSDHRMITFSISGLDLASKNFRNPRRANWDFYRHTLTYLLPPVEREWFMSLHIHFAVFKAL